MLTAKGELDDKLIGFDLGVNDYVTKPFHIEELVARVNVQLRNNNNLSSHDFIEVGDLKLNIRTSNLTCTNTLESIDIVCKEFLLLEYFMNNPNQIISKEQIFNSVWGYDYGDIGTVAVNIKNLRNKIDEEDKYIMTIWGYGYKFIRVSEDDK